MANAGTIFGVGDLVEWTGADGGKRFGRIMEIDRANGTANLQLYTENERARLVVSQVSRVTVPLGKLKLTGRLVVGGEGADYSELSFVDLSEATTTRMSDEEFIRVARERLGSGSSRRSVDLSATGSDLSEEQEDQRFLDALRAGRGDVEVGVPTVAADFTEDDDDLASVSDEGMVAVLRGRY